MSFKIIIITGLFYLIPGNAEIYYRSASSQGNLGLAGVFLDIIRKRNFVYMCGLFYIFTLFTPNKIVRSLFFGLLMSTLFLHLKTIYQWRRYIFHDEKKV